MSLFTELRNRNVFRVAAAYVLSAWLLIQVVETIFPAFGFGPGAVRIVVIVCAIGLVPVLVFSWIFEITPAGIKRETEMDHSQPVPVAAARTLDRVIIVILTLATGFFAFDKFVLDPARDAEIERATTDRVRTETLVESYGQSSIAVLPFRNMSDDPGNEYFSDGISEELLNLLAKIPRLRVISQSSSFSFKGKNIGIPEIAEQLKVAHVLEGSVRKFGNRLRITAQLIEARSDTHLWSETYDRDIEDLFAIQDEISAAIVGELKGHLKLDEAAAPKVTSTTSPEAHDAALRGRYLLAQRVPGARGRAVVEFEKALALDPDFAQAHAELALSLMFAGCADVSDEECRETIQNHVNTALTLDPAMAEAHAAKAYWSFLNGSLDEARVHYLRALDINPNYATVYVWMAGSGLFPNPQEAFDAIERAALLDPLSPLASRAYINALIARNRVDEASRQIENHASIDRQSAIVLRGNVKSLGGNWAESILAALEALDAPADAVNYRWAIIGDLVWQLAATGLTEEALRLESDDHILLLSWFGDAEAGLALAREQFQERPDDLFAHYNMTITLAHAGHDAEALPLLEEGWQFPRRMIASGATGWSLGYHAEALIAILRNAGQKAAADQVLAELNDSLRGHRDAGNTATKWDASLDYLEGVAAYLAGERDNAFALMSKAAADGYWVRPPSVFQRPRYQEREFVAILEEQAIRQARERQKVLAIVCAENYAHTAVWQPSAETCRQHLTADVE